MKQFEAVNENGKWPNVQIFVNHDNKCSVDDLVGVLTGNFYDGSLKSHPIYKKYLEGRIKQEKLKIDLFIFLNCNTSYLFSQQNEGHLSLLCDLFGIHRKNIKFLDETGKI